jgi:group I intron endonuclease
MKSGIYQISCKSSDDFYIGSAKNLNHRWNTHLYCLKNNKHHNIILQRKFNKYGEENFEFKILSKVPVEYLIKLEQWFLDNLNPSINIYKTAYSPIGFKHSEKTRRKLSEQKKGKSRPKEIMNKLKEFNTGRSFSENHKNNLKLAYSQRKFKGNRTILNEEKVKEIKTLLKEGKSLSFIAKIYNISSPMVSRIKNNIAWKEITI